MSEQTVVDPRPDLLEEGVGNAGDWFVIVFNNEVNTFRRGDRDPPEGDGMFIGRGGDGNLGSPSPRAVRVHYAGQAECERVAAIISTIGIKVAVDRL
jgi:hypothetical protein